MTNLCAFIEHSKAFERYMELQEGDVPGFTRRAVNSIAPHVCPLAIQFCQHRKLNFLLQRIGAVLGTLPSTLPKITSREDWYQLVRLPWQFTPLPLKPST
jgi:hypothetical protein